MYKKIKKLFISRKGVVVTNDVLDNVMITFTEPVYYDDKFFAKKLIVHGVDSDHPDTKYDVHCYKNNMVIFDKDDNMVAKIYLPSKVKYIVEKDILKYGLFDLARRKHLRKLYDCSKHLLIKMNYIPEFCEERLESIEKQSEKFSQGVDQPPIVIVYFNEGNYTLVYTILKDSVIVESGEVAAEAPDIY